MWGVAITFSGYLFPIEATAKKNDITEARKALNERYRDGFVGVDSYRVWKSMILHVEKTDFFL